MGTEIGSLMIFRTCTYKTDVVYQLYSITDSTMLQEASLRLAALHASESG